MFRRLLCKWFNLIRNEDVEDEPGTGWDDLWVVKEKRIIWPRLVKSDAWVKDIEPFFKQSLLRTFTAMTFEQDTDKLRRLQERAKLINEWLEQPRIAVARDEAVLNNAFQSGQVDRLTKEMERANAR